MLGELFVDWLITGGKRPECAQLSLFLSMAAFGLLLFVALLLRNGSSPVAAWPDGSYYGLMLATFSAIPGLPVGAVHSVRYRTDRPLSAACVVVSCAGLLVSFWLFTR
jgi:hypothetical protein